MGDAKITAFRELSHPAVAETGEIFAVTAIRAGEERRSRMFGYFFKEETARQAVLENWLDMYECGYYDHVVVERMPPGIHPFSHEVQWYRWDTALGWYELGKTPGSWQPAEKPAGLENTVNFCFG